MRATLGSGTTDLLRAVQGAGAGNEHDINSLVRHCLPAITSYLRVRDAEHPEALANQVLAEVMHRLPGLAFGTHEQFWNYVYKVAKSRLVDEKRGRKAETVLRPLADLDATTVGFADEVVDRAWLTELVDRLTTDQQQVIRLRFEEDLTLAETAQRTGKTVNAVKSMQRRALAALATAAAAALAIVLVLLGARWFGTNPVNVQSLEPADEAELVDQRGTDPAIPDADRRLDGDQAPEEPLDRPSLEVASSRPSSQGPERATTASIAPVVPPEANSSKPTGPAPTAPEPVAGDADPDSAASASDRAETASTEAEPAGTAGPAATTPSTPPPPSAGPSGAEPLSVTTAEGDAVMFDLMTAGVLWLDLRVMVNNTALTKADTLRVITQPSAGLVEVVEGRAGLLLRYHPTAPGQHTIYYEACVAGECHSAPLTLPVSWYNETICIGLEATIVGTPGDDTLVGTAGNDIIFGLEGDDVIDGGGGIDIICGGPGNDTLRGDATTDLLVGGAGNDHLYGYDGNDVLLANDGDDRIFGGPGDDLALGGGGDDLVNGDAGTDSLYGEAGGDTLHGGDGNDRIFGGPGTDWIGGDSGADLLHGGPDSDEISSAADGAANRIFGGVGSDRLFADSQFDTVDGQDGYDTCTASVPVVNCESLS